jgi:hypothetical protein
MHLGKWNHENWPIKVREPLDRRLKTAGKIVCRVHRFGLNFRRFCTQRKANARLKMSRAHLFFQSFALR